VEGLESSSSAHQLSQSSRTAVSASPRAPRSSSSLPSSEPSLLTSRQLREDLGEGVTLAEVHKVALAVITKAGYADAFIHGTSHHLGLETHDVTPDEPLKAGAVITVEPGIYLPKEKIGVRIEDDVLVTPKGAKVLSTAIPKTVADIEKIMAK
jgi:hypothetical protein